MAAAQLLERLLPALQERRAAEERARMAADRLAALRAAALDAQAGLGRRGRGCPMLSLPQYLFCSPGRRPCHACPMYAAVSS